MQTLKSYYIINIEPSLDAMSNGEATLFGFALTAVAGFLVWFSTKMLLWLGGQVYKRFQKESPEEEQEEQSSKLKPDTGKPTTPRPTPRPKPLPHTSNTKLFGRKKELSLLTRAWNNDKQNIVVLKAMGGTGKTALLKHWLDGFNDTSKRTPPDKIYTWSFYSQGSAEDKQASADVFFDEALAFFDYQGDSIASAHDKGFKLAELVNQQPTLLVLDGLEPLQNPVGVMHGDLKDKGLRALLQQLAAHNQGLCLISSRQDVVELEGKPLVLAHDLGQLQTPDGVALLEFLLKPFGGHNNKADLENAVKEVAGHALALNLLGNYVKTLFKGDIRQRDKITNLSAEREEGKHAEKVLAAYENHLQGTAELSILYLLGLFDRPASISAFNILLKENLIKKGFFEIIVYTRKNAGKIRKYASSFSERVKYMETFDSHTERLLLIKPINELSEAEWKYSLKHLREQQLLNSDDENNKLDTHPLIREYFAKRLKANYPEAWQQAHHQLYNYYKALPEKELPDTLEEMEPLFAAIAHGCAAGMYQEALDDVYWPRIQRENDYYLTRKLGAFGTDLSILAHFFSQHWHTPDTKLTDNAKSILLTWIAFRLQALGRLEEAAEPMQAGLDSLIKQKNWKSGSSAASNLSGLQLTR